MSGPPLQEFQILLISEKCLNLQCCNNRCFRETYLLHHQGDNKRRAGNNVSSKYQPKIALKKYYVPVLYNIMYTVFLRSTLRVLVTAHVVPCLLILVTLMMGRYVPSKRQVLQEPHGVTSQKTAFFIVTVLKTSNLYLLFSHYFFIHL
jgi:hypothetical protein